MDDFGGWLSRGFKAWTDHFKDWIWPAAKAVLIGLAAYLCCCLPGYLAIGPLAVGLFSCAFHALEGWGPTPDALGRGKERMGDAILAWFLKALIVSVPITVLIGVTFGPFFIAMMSIQPNSSHPNGWAP